MNKNEPICLLLYAVFLEVLSLVIVSVLWSKGITYKRTEKIAYLTMFTNCIAVTDAEDRREFSQ